jgi:8-oxo-dGTP pyrophosphatase MutT (NUDIX family)
MDPARTLPPHLAEAARAYASGERTAVEPRLASTVVLLREGDGEAGGLEAYLLHRHLGMEFAADMYVFPGGGVDPRDSDLDPSLWAGPSVAEWAARLGCPEQQARELICAAVRETFEESGVLLAGTAEVAATAGEVAGVVADTTGAEWESDRAALESRELSLTELLTRRGLVLRTDLLAGLGCWVTPNFESRRYRTWFFVAALPAGQVTRDVSTESDRVAWLTIREALRAVSAGEILMLPPTSATLGELYPAASPASALEIARAVPWEVVEPTFDLATGTLVIPDRFAELGRTVLAALNERHTVRARYATERMTRCGPGGGDA